MVVTLASRNAKSMRRSSRIRRLNGSHGALTAEEEEEIKLVLLPLPTMLATAEVREGSSACSYFVAPVRSAGQAKIAKKEKETGRWRS